MDPLSITVSTLTILSTLETAFQLIKSYRDAPGQLEALNNEITDIAAVVTEVARVLNKFQDKFESLSDEGSHLTLALSNISEKARELEALFRSCVVVPSSASDGPKVSRISWLKMRSKVQRLQSELRDGRLNLSIALAVFTASSSLRIELDVREIFLVTNETSMNQQRLKDRFDSERDQDRLGQDRFCAQILAHLENLQLHRRETGQHLTDIQGTPGDIAENSLKPLRTNEESLEVPVRSSPRSDFGSNQVGHWSSIGIRADMRNISECSRICNCSCHVRRSLKSPRLLDGLLGTLFVGYSGSPLLSQRCDQVSCRGRKNSSTSFIYHFPRWFLISRMIQLKAKVTALYGPEVSLRFNRVVDGKALVFYYATTGDLSKMKQLFQQGCASPNDVRFDSGWTPFHYAIQNNQIEICKLLLQAGGDPYMETEAPTTAAEYAGAKVLGNSAEVGTTKNLRELFFDTHLLEYGKFSALHEIVLHIRPGNIYEELQRSTALLDTVDSTGRSPLSWAAQRGEDETVRLLLEYGADPNNNDNTNMTPLHYAAQANTPKCLLLLIEYGAKISQSTRGWTALHYACCYHDDVAYVKPLFDHGADVDKRTYVGKTALFLAIIQNHLRIAAFLIGLGADLNVLDSEGISPLAVAIKFRRLDPMKLLLPSGATHKLLSGGDDTLLHLVAKFPDVKIIQYLSDFDLGNVDVDARNKENLTARELIQIHNSDPDIALTFQKLLRKVAERREQVVERMPKLGAQDVDDSDSSTDIFEDAVE